MNTKRTEKQYRKDTQFIDFKNHVLTFLHDLDIEKAKACDHEDYFAVGCIAQLARFVKVRAVCLYNDVQLEDDEYGTLAYTGYVRSYSQARDYFLAWLAEDYSIRPVYYDGELNSYSISLQQLMEVVSRIMTAPGIPDDQFLEDDELPF